MARLYALIEDKPQISPRVQRGCSRTNLRDQAGQNHCTVRAGWSTIAPHPAAPIADRDRWNGIAICVPTD